MENSQDAFTIADRRELIKQGMQLDQLDRGLSDVRTLVRDDIQEVRKASTALEGRVRILEDFRLQLRAQVVTSIWILGAVFTVANVLANIVLRIWWH